MQQPEILRVTEAPSFFVTSDKGIKETSNQTDFAEFIMSTGSTPEDITNILNMGPVPYHGMPEPFDDYVP